MSYDNTPWWEREEKEKLAKLKASKKLAKKENSFYAAKENDGIIKSRKSTVPKFDTISEYNNEIEKQESKLDDLHHQQYLHMIFGRNKEMDNMNGLINQANDEKKALETARDSVLGVDVDRWGSQNKSDALPNREENPTQSSLFANKDTSKETSTDNDTRMTDWFRKIREERLKSNSADGEETSKPDSSSLWDRIQDRKTAPKASDVSKISELLRRSKEDKEDTEKGDSHLFSRDNGRKTENNAIDGETGKTNGSSFWDKIKDGQAEKEANGESEDKKDSAYSNNKPVLLGTQDDLKKGFEESLDNWRESERIDPDADPQDAIKQLSSSSRSGSTFGVAEGQKKDSSSSALTSEEGVFKNNGTQSETDSLKEKVKDTYTSVILMSDEERIAFMQSDAGKEYQQNIKALEEGMGKVAFEEFSNDLFGEDSGEESTLSSGAENDDVFDGVTGTATAGADAEEEYPSEPYPSPIPGAPPVEDDMEAYEEKLDGYEEYEKEHDEWEEEVDRIDSEKEEEYNITGKDSYVKKVRDDKREQDDIQIDFTSEEFVADLAKYDDDIYEYAKDLAAILLEEYPSFDGWSAREIAADITMHYDLYEMGIGGERVSTCDIGQKKDQTKFFASLYLTWRNRHKFSD